MRQYTYWQAIIKSFYSRDLYRDVKKNWGASVVTYLILVLVLYCISKTFVIQQTLNQDVPVFVRQFVMQLPEITIQNGLVKTPENKPYYVIEPDTKKIIFIVDTSGQYLDLSHTTADHLLTQQRLYSRDKADTVRIETISSKLNMDIQPAEVQKKITTWLKWAWVIVFPALLLFTFFYRLIQAAFYAICGKVISLFSEKSLAYGHILQLSIVALTPSILIKAVVLAMHVRLPWQGYIFFLITLGYLVFAMMANKEE